MKYFLKADWQEEYQEVTKEQYIKEERRAGFFPKSGNDKEIATANFYGNGISGMVKYEPEDLEKIKESLKEK